MSMISDMLTGFAKNVILGQARTWTPTIAGGLITLGVQNQVSATSLEGSVYYILSSLFVIIPASFSYLNKKSVAQLVTAAVAAAPGTPEAAALITKVS